MYFNKVFFLISLASIFGSCPLWGFDDGTIVLNGSYHVTNSIDIVAKRLSGRGFLGSKKITIYCDEFCFEGTIECSEEFTLIIDSDESEKEPLDFKQVLIRSRIYQKLRELIGDEK